MECQCERDNPEDAGWWLNGSNVQMGAFTVVGYLLYRFSQTLPALIRWPIRLFCSLTGLSALWGWVSHLVGTLRGIQSLCKWLSRVWKFFVGCSSKFKWLGALIRKVTGSLNDGALESEIDPTNVPGLRLILLGPNGGHSSLSNTLLGTREAKQPIGHLTESTKIKTLLDGREVTVIATPDILGPSLGNNKRAKEALRSLQLTSPGPHVFLLVIPAPESSTGINQEAAQAIQATHELFGDGAVEYILPVFTHVVNRGQKQTVEKLLDGDAGGLRRALSPCDQRPELVDITPDRPLEEQSVLRRHLLGRVMEMKTLRGHFVHELQRREDRIREELLADMTSEVARKLGHM
ncbi:GTPase IMAP family member 5-like [Labrus mixtus]|uniref:GTPase IMAP family member 5-like n=1 Tax=Labrus mixtus TaxID=508554 RepID=UPI0029BFCE7A|nr:GTPase IMAP family member 5-like [Labrus mixtus]XP_060884828.1 GTPase IMAP family member 5-like [Labrus mixtus]XP_060884829.1 GTPase IMAP family member 5-like [Labrus mixtus]